MPSSTDDVEVLDITDVAEMQLIDELKKWGLDTKPECAFGENARLYVEGIGSCINRVEMQWASNNVTEEERRFYRSRARAWKPYYWEHFLTPVFCRTNLALLGLPAHHIFVSIMARLP